MKVTTPSALAALASLALAHQAAAVYTTITVDGNPADWAGVPVLISDPVDNTGNVDVTAISVANDDNFLYIKVDYATTVTPTGNGGTHLAIDVQNDGVGFDVFGLGAVFADFQMQNDFPFESTPALYNTGDAILTGSGIIMSPGFGTPTAFNEYAIARDAEFTNPNALIFPAPTIELMSYLGDGTDITEAGTYTFVVPEPATIGLVGVGTLLVGRRRR